MHHSHVRMYACKYACNHLPTPAPQKTIRIKKKTKKTTVTISLADNFCSLTSICFYSFYFFPRKNENSLTSSNNQEFYDDDEKLLIESIEKDFLLSQSPVLPGAAIQ